MTHSYPEDSRPEADEAADPGEGVEYRALTLPSQANGQRLDKVLAELLPEFSRSYLQQLIEQGLVRKKNVKPGDAVAAPAKASLKTKAGEEWVVELRPTPQSQAFKPEPMALDIVHRDEHLLIVNKPVGLVVHPAPGNWSGTLLNGLLAADAQAAQLPRAGIVHRLDKDTSGLMVVARTRAAMDALVALIARRDVSRQYLALAHRPWRGGERREVNAPIGRDPANRLRMAVVDLALSPGKTASTTIEPLVSRDAWCWVRCTLGTGRTHQIRVHMASLGHPLVGDALYGGAPAGGLHRQALHAWRLAFVHPMTGEPLCFYADLPQDMAEAGRLLGLSYNESHPASP
ncbi:MAG: Ribosomal large subunit pseudouridine synthase D [Paracidovorax wautersii]|uniref:Pseudouridine synthase n=1 Tax=Paracidovorax wautersii TaxID=1177982 RepID=A0A7V8FQX4_9BURK|nr:MAG: Ribosomal large subunit pseudouridine synthase D [Paracidovorax wautersii]